MKLDADEIVPGLWQGAVPPEGNLVGEMGFDLLVLTAREFQRPAEEYPGVEVLHAPNDDSSLYPLNRQKLQVALEAAHKVNAVRAAGGSVLVTCAAGLNRSGLVVALALYLALGWSGDECIRRIRSKRRPKGNMGPCSNSEFNEALRRLPRGRRQAALVL